VTIEVGQRPMWIMSGFSSFKLVVFPFVRRRGTISSMKYLVLQPFDAGENRAVSRFVGL
jgi:hypothetical protein